MKMITAEPGYGFGDDEVARRGNGRAFGDRVLDSTLNSPAAHIDRTCATVVVLKLLVHRQFGDRMKHDFVHDDCRLKRWSVR